MTTNNSLHYLDTVSSEPWGSELEVQEVINCIKAWSEDPTSDDISDDLILWDLCRRGYIEPGDYRMYVSW